MRAQMMPAVKPTASGRGASFSFHPLRESVDNRTALGGGGATGKRRASTVAREFNILALIKGEERYIFVYDDESRPPLIDAFRDQAANPHLSFTWFDAAVLTEKAREQARQRTPVLPRSRL
jgi:hypothetical protein